MSDVPRPAEPRVINPFDDGKLREAAAELACRLDVLTEAIARVGLNRTAVELYLTARKA